MNEARVLIIGGGFAGLEAAKVLNDNQISTILVDKENHHLFQPLLYQVAGAGLAAPSVAAPLRHSLRNHKYVQVLRTSVQHFDPKTKTATFGDGTKRSFEAVLICCGAITSYFGHDDWEQFAPGLKTLNDAQKIRHMFLDAFERAELCQDPMERAKALTFVIVGAGPTGVELAGSLAEIAHDTLLGEFRSIDTQHANIVLLEGSPRVLATFQEPMSAWAQGSLEQLGVDVRTQCRVTNITKDQIEYLDRSGNRIVLNAGSIVWAAGVAASNLTKQIGTEVKLPSDRSGRLAVNGYLQLSGFTGVYAAGDCALAYSKGKPVPGLAPAAKQMGRCAALNIKAQMQGSKNVEFVYRDQGALATIGHHKAIAQFNKFSLTGYPAWLFWLFVHVFFLIGWRNRMVVLSDWAWSYWTKQRWARIVSSTGDKLL